jgi:homoserine kinase type II
MPAVCRQIQQSHTGRRNVLAVSGEDDVGLADLPADLPALEAAFSLPPISGHRYLADGWMNRNWEVFAGSGRYVLRRILDIPAATARSILAAVSWLASRPVPVAVPVRTVNGDTVVDLEGRRYCLIPWVDGKHRVGGELSLPAVARLGHLVGTIHQALADVPGECGLTPVPDTLKVRITDAAAAEELIGRIDRIIAGIAEPTPYDVRVRALLRRRVELLRGHAHLRSAVTASLGPFGRIHGDLNMRNLLFRGEEVVAVLDWDRMRVGAYVDEVVRSGQVVFGGEDGVLDLERVAVFSAAYRRVIPVAGQALADAVSRLWWKRLTDVWPVEFRYMRGEPSERIAGLFPPGEQVLEWWTRHLKEVRDAFADGC